MRIIKSGDVFETKAYDTYLSCVDLGFNRKWAFKYNQRNRLYANESLSNEKAVWMLHWCYGDGFLNKDHNSKNKKPLQWRNEISKDWHLIKETYYIPISEEVKSFKDLRVVFAKRKDETTHKKFKYVFLGVYKRKLVSNNQYEYTRVSKIYPY